MNPGPRFYGRYATGRSLAPLVSCYKDCVAHTCAIRSAASAAFDLLLILIYPPHREAERRFCAVGLPAWMPGEPRWAMDGPWRRAHGAGPERGNLSAAKAVRQGQAFLVTFSASGKSDSL